MKVTPQEELSWHKARLKKLAKHRQAEIKQQQKETALVRKDFQNRKKEVQLQGEEDIHTATLNSRKEIGKAMSGKKEKLEKFRTENIKHQKLLENQRLDLDNYNDLRSTDMNSQFEQKYNEIFLEGSEKVQNLEKDINDRYSNIKENSELEVKHYRADMEAKLKDSSNDFGSRVKNNQDSQKEALRRSDIQHATKVGRQELAHRDDTAKLLEGQKHETQSRTIIHQGNVKTMDDRNQEQLKSKKLAFEKKTKQMEQDHLSVLGLMKERFTNRLNEVKDAFSKKKAMVEDKNTDPFYNVAKINPIVQEAPDSYIVSMKVPEHEKDNINVSPRNRSIKITYHRKHSDRVEELDGSTNTSKRTELMTKQIPTSEILSPKDVTQKYENGVLKFKIKKA